MLDVLDGDTFIARAKVWPGHAVTVRVRIRGIDAPEMRARCEAEKIAAWRAKEMLAGLVAEGPVAILNIGGGKYYGRVLADVAGANGEDVASVLLRLRHVRRYDGGRREGWCP